MPASLSDRATGQPKRKKRRPRKREYTLGRDFAAANTQERRVAPTYRQSAPTAQRRLRRAVDPLRDVAEPERPEEGAAQRDIRGQHRRPRPLTVAQRLTLIRDLRRPQEGRAELATSRGGKPSAITTAREVPRLVDIAGDEHQSLERRYEATKQLRTRWKFPITQNHYLDLLQKDREQRLEQLPRTSRQARELTKAITGTARYKQLGRAKSVGEVLDDVGDVAKAVTKDPLGKLKIATLTASPLAAVGSAARAATKDAAETTGKGPLRRTGPTRRGGVGAKEAGLGVLPVSLLVNTARATYEDPEAVAKSSLRTAKESIAGLPQAAKMLVENPGEALKAIAKDYQQRYGPLLAGNSKVFRERMKKDYGLTPYTLDALGFAGGSGVAVGAVGRSTAAAALAARLTTRGSRLAPAARGFVTAASREGRPNLRTAPGEKGVRKQRGSTSIYVRQAQRALDTRRAEAYTKRHEAAGLRKGRGGKLEPIPGADPKHFDALRPGEGEVVRLSSPRDLPFIRRLAGRTERDLGREKSALRSGFLGGQRKLERAARKPTLRLDNKEKRALRYTMTFGLDPDNIGAAVNVLRQRRREITAARRGQGEKPAMYNDELVEINAILRDPEAHITPRVRQSADELRRLEKRKAGTDPGLVAERAAVRRYAEQAQVFGERRRGDVPFYERALKQIEDKSEGRHKGLVERYGQLGALEPDQRKAVVKSIERHTTKQARKAHRRVVTLERQAARVRGATEVRVAQADARLLKAHKPFQQARRALGQAGREQRAARKAHTAAHKTAPNMHTDAERTATAVRLEAAEAGAKKAREDFDTQRQRAQETVEAPTAKNAIDELKDLGRAPRRSLAKLQKIEADARMARAARDDANYEREVARMVGRVKGRSEPAKEFIERVHKKAVERGLRAPAYFESTPGTPIRHSLFAAGSGIRGVAPSRKYTGSLYRLGYQSNDPEVAVAGILRNAKRRFSWRYTANTLREVAFPWSKGRSGGGMTASEINRYMAENQIDPDTVEFINPRVVERHENETAGLDDQAEVLAPSEGVHPEDVTGIREALTAARLSHGDLVAEANATVNMKGTAMNRYLVVPKRHFDELSQSMKPDGVFGRGLDVILRQKPARIMLALANIPWLAFQIGSNGFLSGLGRTLNPFDYAAAQRWWRKDLTGPERDAIEPYLGITHGMHHASDQTHLAASTNNRFVNAGRAFKKASTHRQFKVPKTEKTISAHDLNPLDAMFRGDEAQNNFFRRAVFYSSAKREAYRRMGASWTSLEGVQKKVLAALPVKPPKTRAEFDAHMKAIIHNREAFEQHAGHVRDWLGDYLTYTTKERQTIGRMAMFYGYLRFSLRLAFWTMPVHHPVMTAILGDLGRMGSQEVKRLLGVPANFNVPTNMLANMYFGTAEQVQEGEGGMLPIGRMNPLLNAITQMERPQQIVGLFSPVIQAEVDQAFHVSSFTGREWNLSTHQGLTPREKEAAGFGSWFSQFKPGTPRNRILLKSMLGIAAPYRAAEDVGLPGANVPGASGVPLLGKPLAPLEGPQFTDSTIFSPHPRSFKDPETVKSIEKSIGRQRETPAIRKLLPFVGPLPTSNAQILQNLRETQADIANKRMGKTKKRKRKPRTYGSGGAGYGSGGGGYGGGGGGY